MPSLSDPAALHAPMPDFERHEGELRIGGHSLRELAASVGADSFYVYDRASIRAQVQALRKVLPRGVALHYAMKANPMPALVSFMAGLVDGVDAASSQEVGVALAAGVSPLHVSLAGPGKRDTELQQAVAAGVLVNVESMRELPVLAQASQALGRPARVAVRVNPDFSLRGAGMKMGGGATPFGIDAEDVPEALAWIAREALAFEGFHFYVGSQTLNAASICEAQRLCYALALKLAQHAPSPVRVLNLGGGFGIPYFPGERRLDLAPIGGNLAQLVAQAAQDLPQAQIVIELGRYLVGEAGLYVTRVVDRKRSRGQVFLVCDGGLNHHLAASGNFGQVLRKNYPVTIVCARDAGREIATVVGPLCTPLDVLAQRMDLPVAAVGDLVVVFQSGAYGATASPQDFLGHPRCRELLV